MSELNHELDRDNLNKAYNDTAKSMARLIFPDGRKRYIEELDEKINTHPDGKSGWDAFADGIKEQHRLGISFWNAKDAA